MHHSLVQKYSVYNIFIENINKSQCKCIKNNINDSVSGSNRRPIDYNMYAPNERVHQLTFRNQRNLCNIFKVLRYI